MSLLLLLLKRHGKEINKKHVHVAVVWSVWEVFVSRTACVSDFSRCLLLWRWRWPCTLYRSRLFGLHFHFFPCHNMLVHPGPLSSQLKSLRPVTHSLVRAINAHLQAAMIVLWYQIPGQILGCPGSASCLKAGLCMHRMDMYKIASKCSTVTSICHINSDF